MTMLDAGDDLQLEECIDELDAAVEKLERFPPTVLACALRSHLHGLLQALSERGQVTHAEVGQFIQGLQIATDPPKG